MIPYMIGHIGRLPNTTIKFPEPVKLLIKRDAEREGHHNMSHVVRRIVMQHYGLIKRPGRTKRD